MVHLIFVDVFVLGEGSVSSFGEWNTKGNPMENQWKTNGQPMDNQWKPARFVGLQRAFMPRAGRASGSAPGNRPTRTAAAAEGPLWAGPELRPEEAERIPWLREDSLLGRGGRRGIRVVSFFVSRGV